MYKSIIITLLFGISPLYGEMSEEKIGVQGLNSEVIARHEQEIKNRETRFTFIRHGMTLSGVALAMLGVYKLYTWSGSKAPDVAANVVTPALAEKVDLILEKVDALTLAHNSSGGASAAPIHTSSGWATSVFNNWTFNAAVFAGIIGIQYTLPKLFSGLDQIYYTFSYPWFINNRSQLRASFDELERVAFAFDREHTIPSYRENAFIVAFNHVLRECEQAIAFMNVQNQALEVYGPVNARYMCVITNNLMKVIESYQTLLGSGQELPRGYFSWVEFAKSLRESVNRHGESYAYNEERILASVMQGT